MALDLDAAAARPSVSRRAPALLPPLLLCTSSVGEGYIRDHGGRSGSGDARSRSNGGGRVGTMANSPSMTLLTSPPLTRSASAAPAARRPSSSAAMRRGGNSPAPPTQPWTRPTTPSELWQQPQSEFRVYSSLTRQTDQDSPISHSWRATAVTACRGLSIPNGFQSVAPAAATANYGS